MRGAWVPVCLATMAIAGAADAKGGHGGGHGGHGGHGGGHHGGSGRVSGHGSVSGSRNAHATPLPPAPSPLYVEIVAEQRARAPESAPPTFSLPSAAGSLLIELDHSFDRAQRLEARLGQLWRAPEHAAMFHGMWRELAPHPEVRDGVAAFVRAHAAPAEVEQILAE